MHLANPSAEHESSLSKLEEFLLALQIKFKNNKYSIKKCGSWRVPFTQERRLKFKFYMPNKQERYVAKLYTCYMKVTQDIFVISLFTLGHTHYTLSKPQITDTNWTFEIWNTHQKLLFFYKIMYTKIKRNKNTCNRALNTIFQVVRGKWKCKREI